MYRTALIAGIRKCLGYCLQHTEIFIADDKTDAGKAAFFEPYKESTPAVFILFHAFSGTDDLPAAVFIDTNGNKDRNILDLPTPAPFEIDTVNVDIWILSRKGACTSLLDMLISLLVEIAYCSGRYFGSPECSRDVFYPAYEDSCQIHLDQDLFHRGFPSAVTLNNGGFKRNAFEFGNIEFHLPDCGLKIPFIMA